MPRFDKTGPIGEGPMTGRKMGKCKNFDDKKGFVEETELEIINTNQARGMGSGLGRGRRGCGGGMGRTSGRRCGSGLRSGAGPGRGDGKCRE
jgi:hypothetical protein